PLGNDRWAADVTLGPPGRVVFTIEAWPDLYRSWVSELERKVAVGRDVQSELLEGAGLLRACAARADAAHATHDAQLLDEAASVLEGPPMDGIGRATEARVVDAAARYPDRSIGRRDPLERPVLVERERARTGPAQGAPAPASATPPPPPTPPPHTAEGRKKTPGGGGGGGRRGGVLV